MGQKKLGFGFMRLPLKDKDDWTSIDMEELDKMVDRFIDDGFSYFDLAYIYHEGECESAFRKTVANRHARGKFTVATKMPMFMLKSREQQKEIFSEQLQKCGVEYFDYYLLHDLNDGTWPTAVELDSFDFISERKKTGQIHNVGFSFHASPELLNEILAAHPEIDFVQLQINYLDWDNASIQSRKCWEMAKKHGKKIIVMEPLKGGTLAVVPEKAQRLFKNYAPELSVASWAIRFAASQENVVTVLSGMSDFAQLADNTSYMKDFIPLSEKEFDVVHQALSVINESVAIPCTTCRYCVSVCPKDIAIPEYFALYNAEQKDVNRGASTQLAYYHQLEQKRGKPTDCIACKQCEAICPQHLPVMKHLKTVAGELDSALEKMLTMFS